MHLIFHRCKSQKLFIPLKIRLLVSFDCLTSGRCVFMLDVPLSFCWLGFQSGSEVEGTTKNQNMENSKKEILAMIHKSLANGIRNAKADVPRNWLKERNLTLESSGAVFNSGQMHHRKPQEFKEALESVGFLTQSDVPTNNGQVPYTSFGNYSVMFPLKDEHGDVVNFYAIRIKNNQTAYLNSEGIYPAYPHEGIRKLYIVNSIIGAATILEAKVLDNKEAVMALFDGEIMPQHEEVLKRLTQLEEVIWVEQPNSKK